MSAPARSGGMRSDDWVERVREASDIVEVVGQTVALRRAGRNFSGLCPFHKEKTPSFSVNAERQFFHCFGCKVGGDVFKFVMEHEKIGFLEAVELLSHRAGIPVPERRPGERGQRAALLEALESAAAAYEHWLADPQAGAAVRAYLERRGIARDTQRQFRLGLAPAGWTNLADRLRGRVREEVLVEAGLAARREGRSGVYDRFRDRLMVPLVAPGGQVVGFGARTLGEEGPKYLNSPETPVYHKSSFVFGFDAARRAAEEAGEFVLVEGYFDVIALHQAGVTHAAATSGTALTPEQARLLKRVAPGVALTFDGDAAGREAMMRSLGVLLAEGLDVAVLSLPAGQDPDTFVREHGVEGWRALRAEALDAAGFVQRHVAGDGAPGDPRERGLQAIVRLAQGVGDPIRARLLLERGAEVFGMPVAVLSRALSRARGGAAAAPVVERATAVRRARDRDLEAELVTALLQEPDAVAEVRAELEPHDLSDPELRQVAERLWSDPHGVMDDEAAGPLARELLAASEGSMNWRAIATGATRRLVQRRLRARIKDIHEALKRTRDDDAVLRLMGEATQIGNRLTELERALGESRDVAPDTPSEAQRRS